MDSPRRIFLLSLQLSKEQASPFVGEGTWERGENEGGVQHWEGGENEGVVEHWEGRE